MQGPAGIGKTALLEQFLADGRRASRAFTVLRGSGEEAESLLDYGVLGQLARSAGPAGAALLAVTERPSAPEPILAGTRLLELLGELETAGPVVLVVDDLHWADRPSVRALVFAVRRLVADQVLVVLATRDDASTELPESLRRVVSGHHGDVVRLAGLDEGDLRELADAARDRGAARPRRAAAARRHARATRCTPAPCSTRSPGSTGSGRVGGRAAAAPGAAVVPRCWSATATRRAPTTPAALVDAAAVLGMRSPLPLAAQRRRGRRTGAGRRRGRGPGLLIAETAAHPWALAFPHPLVRSAVHDALGPARRPGAAPRRRRAASRARSRCCTTGSPRRRRRTARSPTTSRRSPAGRRRSSGRAPPATSSSPPGCVPIATRAAAGCSSR